MDNSSRHADANLFWALTTYLVQKLSKIEAMKPPKTKLTGMDRMNRMNRMNGFGFALKKILFILNILLIPVKKDFVFPVGLLVASL